MNKVATEFNQKLGKSFTPVKGNPVLILSNGMIKTVPFGNATIGAIPCSTIAENMSKLQCTQTLTDVLEAQIISQVRCPKTCIERFKKEKITLEGYIV